MDKNFIILESQAYIDGFAFFCRKPNDMKCIVAETINMIKDGTVEQ